MILLWLWFRQSKRKSGNQSVRVVEIQLFETNSYIFILQHGADFCDDKGHGVTMERLSYS